MCADINIDGPLSRSSTMFSSRFAPRAATCITASSKATRRNISASAATRNGLKGWGTVINIAAGGYIGGLIVCIGSLYFLYKDANSRQHIPFEMKISNQIIAVKAISKDDVLKSPRYAVKHYRRLLIDLAKEAKPDLVFEETLPDGQRNYMVPLLNTDELLRGKSSEFMNFYVDIVLRYAKALLAKGHLYEPVILLKHMVADQEVFYGMGDVERMSQCCRLLSKASLDVSEKEGYLQRSVDMLKSAYLNVKIDSKYLIAADSLLSDELLLTLNSLAYTYARSSKDMSRKEKQKALGNALNIYLANLRLVSDISQKISIGEITQLTVPLFNCDPENTKLIQAELKAHVSEILWARGFRQEALSWGEEVIDEIFFDRATNPRAVPILSNVLGNLKVMYKAQKNAEGQRWCDALSADLHGFEAEPISWYDSVVRRFTKIIYYKGPLGILEKALKERFGSTQVIPEIEQYENEDEEV